MELRQNFGLIVWILPFYASLTAGFFYPPAFGYAFAFGLALTVGGLFVQVKLNEWIAREFNLLRVIVDYRPRVRGKSPTVYSRWPSITQIWMKGSPREFIDQYGWTTCWIHCLNGGYRHPSLNNRAKVHWLVLRYRGKWNDIVKFLPGSGVFRGSVVDLTNVATVWCTEIISDSLPNRDGKDTRELLNLTPAARVDDDGVLKWIPKLIIRRATGTIDEEIDSEEEAAKLRVAPEVMAT